MILLSAFPWCSLKLRFVISQEATRPRVSPAVPFLLFPTTSEFFYSFFFLSSRPFTVDVLPNARPASRERPARFIIAFVGFYAMYTGHSYPGWLRMWKGTLFLWLRSIKFILQYIIKMRFLFTYCASRITYIFTYIWYIIYYYFYKIYF